MAEQSPTPTPTPTPVPVPVSNTNDHLNDDIRNNALRHRHSSIVDYIQLTKNRQQDLRAEQRTFEGAYIRTALGQMTFSLVIIKMFSKEYVPVGTIFIVYSLLMILIAVIRGSAVARAFLRKKRDNEATQEYFRTSGDTVLFTGILSLASYVALLVIILRI